MAKKLDTSACTATVGFPPKQGTWDFLQQAHQEEAAAIVEGMIGASYSPGTIYVIDGCVYSTTTSTTGGVTTTYANITPGALFFNGEIFPFSAPTPFPIITGSQTVVADMVVESYVTNPITGGPANADPVQFAGTTAAPIPVHDIRTVSFSAGTSGSGMFASQASYPAGSTTGTVNDIGNFVYLSNIINTNINQLIENQTGGMAAAFGAAAFATGAPPTTPILMSGMISSSGGGMLFTENISPGWFFYNGQYVYFLGGSYSAIGLGDVLLITVGSTLGVPTATLSYGASVTDATHFPLSAMKSWATAVGITAINTAITTLENEVSFMGSWYDAGPLEFGAGWGQAGSGAPTCRFIRDGMGRVYMQGRAVFTGTSTDNVVIQFPSTVYAPSQNLSFPVTINNGADGIVVSVTVTPAGQVTLADLSTVSTLDLSNISFITL